MSSITFVIPTKNEANTLASILKDIREESQSLGIIIDKILITDDSSDRTREIAKQQKISIVHGGGRGLGEAMYRGLKEASKTQADYIVSVDADGQTNLKELGTLLAPLQSGVADLVLSSRKIKRKSIKYKYPFINAWGISILVWFLRKGTGLKLTDSHGGLRAMVRPIAEELEMIGVHTYVQETIFDAHQKGYRIIEVPGEWFKRHGESRVLKSIPKYIFYTLPVIIVRCGYHMTFFLPVFFILLILGILTCTLAWTNLINIFNDRLLITGGILSIIGFLGVGPIIILELLLTKIRRRCYENQ